MGAQATSTCARSCAFWNEKANARHVEEGVKYVYLPAVERETAKKSAIHRLVATFFDGSAKAAAAAFLDPSAAKLSEADLNELESMIRKYRDKRKS